MKWMDDPLVSAAVAGEAEEHEQSKVSRAMEAFPRFSQTRRAAKRSRATQQREPQQCEGLVPVIEPGLRPSCPCPLCVPRVRLEGCPFPPCFEVPAKDEGARPGSRVGTPRVLPRR